LIISKNNQLFEKLIKIFFYQHNILLLERMDYLQT